MVNSDDQFRPIQMAESVEQSIEHCTGTQEDAEDSYL